MSFEDEREMEKDEIENIFASITHFHFDLLLNQIISITHPPIPPKYLSPLLWINTQTHTSQTHIYHKNQQPSMSSSSFKSLHNSSFSFSKQHTQSPSLSPKAIISLVNPQNQSLPPFSLIHLIQFNNVIKLITFPHSSSITHHTPSFISLSQ